MMRFGQWSTHCRRWSAAAIAAACLVACSDDKVAGNSAETGSPELAGILVLDNGDPAGFARVRCVPGDYNAHTGDALPDAFETEADESGNYEFDSIPSGNFSLEAIHKKSGKMLLLQDLNAGDDSVSVSDTLRSAGSFKLLVPGVFDEGTTGVATVIGSTILRPVSVAGGKIVVDSLPADTLDLLVYMGDAEPLEYEAVSVLPGETTVAGDTLTLSFRAPLALPEGVDSIGVSTDIPFALRLDSTLCDFDSLARLTGRWEATRISVDGSRSQLPIAEPLIDLDAKKAVFWVRIDSLNVEDEVELSFNTAKDVAYANDVFPTSRNYRAVYHFESTDVSNSAEKADALGKMQSVALVEGTIGQGVYFGSEKSAFTVDESGDTDREKDVFERAFGSGLSFSLWVKVDDRASSYTIFSRGENQYGLRYAPDSGFVFSMYHEAEAEKLDSAGNVVSDTAGYRFYFATGDSLLPEQGWMHVSFSYSGRVASLFVNGVGGRVEGTYEPWEGSRDDSRVFRMGAFGVSVDEFFFGGAAQSADWMQSCYLNQSHNWPAFE